MKICQHCKSKYADSVSRCQVCGNELVHIKTEMNTAIEKKICESVSSDFFYKIIKAVAIITVIFWLPFMIFWVSEEGGFGFFISLLAFIPLVIILFINAFIKSCHLVVTDKRIYGTAMFGKTVDLPLDSISAVGTSFLQGIDVGTSSGRIKFKLISNNNEIRSEISRLLMDRQQEKSMPKQETKIVESSSADELKKYKDLLDGGVITQEEFDAKKKQLLDL